MSEPLKLITVAAALLINAERRALFTQRPEGKAAAGQWEIPGGKLEPNEPPELALCREMDEELGLTIQPKDLEPLTFISQAYPEYGLHVLMVVYSCRTWQGTPTAREGQGGMAWVTADELESYPIVAADIALIEHVRRALS